VYIFLTRAL